MARQALPHREAPARPGKDISRSYDTTQIADQTEFSPTVSLRTLASFRFFDFRGVLRRNAVRFILS